MRTVNYLTRRGMLRQERSACSAACCSRARAGSRRPSCRWSAASRCSTPALPAAFDGLRLVQIADVHAGVFMPPDRLARVRDLARRLEPELVVFTGDQLDRRQVDAEIFVHGFAGLDAPLGVYGILGNHDHLAAARWRPPRSRRSAPSRSSTAASSSSAPAPACCSPASTTTTPTTSPGPTSACSPGTTPDFRLLLCHRPHGWDAAVAAGADVTLAATPTAVRSRSRPATSTSRG